jgi:hypothetical protein
MVVKRQHGLPERGIFANRVKAAEGLHVVHHPVCVPALDRKVLERFLVDDPLPAALIADQ